MNGLASFGVAFLLLALGTRARANCGADSLVASASGDPSIRPEYALGVPRTIDVVEGDYLRKVPYVRVGSLAVYEGDIVIGDANVLEAEARLGPVTLRSSTPRANGDLSPFGLIQRTVLSGTQKWAGNAIPYEIDPLLPSRDLVLQSMKAWSNATRVTFVARTPGNAPQYRNYVYFTVGSDPKACLSRGLGMMGGRQNVELVDGCGFGQIVHEIGHVLGLGHEQNRSDRDKFVRIEATNILTGYGGQFQPRPSDTRDLGGYDLDSIMHYEANAFSCNGKPTIVPLTAMPPGGLLGQRTHVSLGDRAAINAIYK